MKSQTRHSRASGNPDNKKISRTAGQYSGFVRFAEYSSLLDSRLRGNDEVLR
jgi:hypothetical protein